MNVKLGRIALAVVGIVAALALVMMGQIWGCALLALGFSGMPGMPGMPRMPPMFGGIPTAPPGAAAGVGAAAAAVGDLGLVDTIQRHGVIAALDTLTTLTYQRGVNVGNIQVPVDAAYISRIDIQTSADFSGTTTNGLYCTCMAQLSGNALVTSGWHRYPGHGHSVGGKTAGAASSRSRVISYATKIAVKGANTMSIHGEMFGSDIGDLSMSVCLVFTSKGRSYGIMDCDMREADISTKDLDTNLTTLGADTLGAIVVPVGVNLIPAFGATIAVGVGVDYASQTRAMVVLSLSGNALGISGFYNYNCEALQVAVTSTGLFVACTEPDVCNLAISSKPSNILELHAMMIEEDPGLVSVAVAVFYGSTEEQL